MVVGSGSDGVVRWFTAKVPRGLLLLLLHLFNNASTGCNQFIFHSPG